MILRLWFKDARGRSLARSTLTGREIYFLFNLFEWTYKNKNNEKRIFSNIKRAQMAWLHAIRFYIFTFYSSTFQSAYFFFFCCPKILCRGKKDKWKFFCFRTYTQGAVIGIMSVCPWHSFLFFPLLLLLLLPPPLTFDSKDFFAYCWCCTRYSFGFGIIFTWKSHVLLQLKHTISHCNTKTKLIWITIRWINHECQMEN